MDDLYRITQKGDPMTEENALTVPSPLAGDQLLAVAEAAEKRIDAVQRIKGLALRVTNHQDWTDQGGKPYLQVSGSEKVARLFGISWRLNEPMREDHEDGHFTYTFKGYFTMGTAEIEVIGTRSSSDPFFSKKGTVPPSEIDRNDVKKGAMTNCIGNGITRLLGIRNLTWEEVRSGGVQQDKVGKVEYKNSKPSSQPAPPPQLSDKYEVMEGPTGTYQAKPEGKGPGKLCLDLPDGEVEFKFWDQKYVAGIEQGNRYARITWEWRGEGKWKARTVVKPVEWLPDVSEEEQPA
jgi:hypothetical protein